MSFLQLPKASCHICIPQENQDTEFIYLVLVLGIIRFVLSMCLLLFYVIVDLSHSKCMMLTIVYFCKRINASKFFVNLGACFALFSFLSLLMEDSAPTTTSCVISTTVVDWGEWGWTSLPRTKSIRYCFRQYNGMWCFFVVV